MPGQKSPHLLLENKLRKALVVYLTLKRATKLSVTVKGQKLDKMGLANKRTLCPYDKQKPSTQCNKQNASLTIFSWELTDNTLKTELNHCKAEINSHTQLNY